MAQAPPDIQNKAEPDLDEEVGRLLAEMAPASDAASSSPTVDAPDAKAAPDPINAELEADLDRMIAEASRDDAPAVAAESAPVAAPEAPAAPVSRTPAQPEPTTIKELDAALAESVDESDALDGDFLPPSEVVGEDAAPLAAPAPPPESLEPPKPAPVRLTVGPAAPAPAPAATPDVEPAHPAPSESQEHEEGLSPLRKIGAGVITVVDLASRPLALRTTKSRQLVGWLGLNMVFLAACVWVFLLLRPAPGAVIASDHAPAAGHSDAASDHKPAPKAKAKADKGHAAGGKPKSGGGGH